MNTLDKLAQLENQHQIEQEARPPHEKLSQEMIVLYLMDHADRVDLSLFSPYDFDRIECQAIVGEIVNYWTQYKIAPTRNAIRQIVENLTIDVAYHESIGKLLTAPMNPREMPGIIQYLKDWQISRIDAQMRTPESDIEECLRRKAAITSPAGSRFNFRSLSDLILNKQEISFLCDGILTQGQPFMLFGPKKSLKTALLCDLAISLATATPFLEKFDVPKPVNVGYFSAESGEQELVDRMETIQKAKGIASIENLKISFEAPRLSNPEDIAGITEFVRKEQIGVMIIDPMYLTLLSGNNDTNAGNFLQMGPLLGSVAQAIKKEGGTPVLCHHTKKTIQRGNELDLDDMSYSGFAEFARQSLAVWRREDLAGVTQNRLAIKTHGYKRAACYDVDIDETTWTATVTDREMAQKTKGRDKVDRRKDEIVMAIASLEESQPEKGVAVRAINTVTGINGTALKKLISDLAAEGRVRPITITKTGAGGGIKWTVV